jgi:hypothetical protein
MQVCCSQKCSSNAVEALKLWSFEACSSTSMLISVIHILLKLLYGQGTQKHRRTPQLDA